MSVLAKPYGVRRQSSHGAAAAVAAAELASVRHAQLACRCCLVEAGLGQLPGRLEEAAFGRLAQRQQVPGRTRCSGRSRVPTVPRKGSTAGTASTHTQCWAGASVQQQPHGCQLACVAPQPIPLACTAANPSHWHPFYGIRRQARSSRHWQSCFDKQRRAASCCPAGDFAKCRGS